MFDFMDAHLDGADTVPEDDADVDWDVAASGLTGVQQDRISLTIRAGTVELDELRVSSTWKGAVIEDQALDRNFMRVRLTQITED